MERDLDAEFELALSEAQLDDIIQNKMRQVAFAPHEAIQQMDPRDQQALDHLLVAANALDRVYLDQMHTQNKQAKASLKQRAARGDRTAQKAQKIFASFNGLEGRDLYAKTNVPMPLFKGLSYADGRALFPEGASAQKIARYLKSHPAEASALLATNTVVRKEGKALRTVPYSIAYATDLVCAAREMTKAARATTHEGLSRYLLWQAKALVNDSDVEAVYSADKHWAELEGSPILFTVSRESYHDMMTPAIAAMPSLQQVLADYGVDPKPKDLIGVHVGLPNAESARMIALFRQAYPTYASQMPLADKWAGMTGRCMPTQMDDLDLVALTGDCGNVANGIYYAQNLPNEDKLWVRLGGAGRLLFNRQVWKAIGTAGSKNPLLLVDPSQHHLFDPDAFFMFLLGHEGGHSMGVTMTLDGRDKCSSLGAYGSAIEEMKADLAALFLTDKLYRDGKLTQRQAESLYLVWAATELPMAKPDISLPHRIRSIMQLNYFREKGAIQFEAGRKLSVRPDLFPGATNALLQECLVMQIEGDAARVNAFAEKYGAWNEAMAYSVDENLKAPSRRYPSLHQPYLDRALKRT